MSKQIVALLVVIPTSVRGFLTHVYEAICDVVLGLRILDGAVHSANQYQRLRIEMDSHCLEKSDVKVADKHLL